MASPQDIGRVETRDSSPHPDHSQHQLEQDLDAARQMSRVRQTSFSHHPASASPPGVSPVMARRGESEHYFEDRLPAGSPAASRQRHELPATSPLALGTSAVPVAKGQARPSPAVTRFYQSHGRRGSNASVDSESHFIDHRHQQHHFSGNYGMGRSFRSPSSMRPSPGIAARPSRNDESALLDEDDTARSVRPGPSGANAAQMLGMEPRDNNVEGTSPRTLSRRPSMVEDDVCFPQPARSPHAEHGQPELYGHYTDEYMEDHHTQHHAIDSGVQMAPGYPYTFDLAALESFAGEERAKFEAATSQGKAGAGGLRHRGAAGTVRNARQLSMASAAAYGISPESDDATFYSRRPRKYTPDEAAAARTAVGGIAGASKYQRKLALFEASAEGADPPGRSTAGPRASGNIMGGGALLEADRRKNSRSDAKTPLLEDKDRAPPYDGTYGEREDEAAGRPHAYSSAFSAGATGNSEKEKPYRFTFYSNALPSTIHARHLFELPAPGQTFEDLLKGRLPRDEEDEDEKDAPSQSQSRPSSRAGLAQGQSASRIASMASTAGPMSGRMEGNTAPATRSTTPQLGEGAFGRPPAGGLSAAKIALQNTVLTSVQGSASGSGNGHSDATAINNGNGKTPTKSAAELAKTLPGGQIMMDNDAEANTWWLDVLCPTDQEMKLLARVFGIHPLTTEDILMEETREKIELFRNYYLVCFRSFDQDPYSPTYLEPLNMYIIVFREGTLSFHFKATPHPQNVRRRIKQLKDYINVTSDWISYALIDDITDAFGPLIQNIEYEVDSIDELVLILREAEQSDMLRRIGTCRKKVMGLLRLMGNKADVVKGLAKRCNENWSVAPKSDIGLYLSDIQDHLITMTQNLNHYEKILSRSHSNYLAQISIEMTDANNEINDVLSKLTALGTVIVPLNVITGLWGMNVNVPGQGVDNLYWFAGIVSVMVVIAVAGYFAAIRYLKR